MLKEILYNLEKQKLYFNHLQIEKIKNEINKIYKLAKKVFKNTINCKIIGVSSFAESKIETIIFGSEVREICNGVFRNSKLKSAIFSSDILEISNHAFTGTFLETVKILLLKKIALFLVLKL